MKFLNLSPTGSDFNLELQSQLRIINANVLYLTREIDQIKKLLNDMRLKVQEGQYYEEEGEARPGRATSPQTELDEHLGSEDD